MHHLWIEAIDLFHTDRRKQNYVKYRMIFFGKLSEILIFRGTMYNIVIMCKMHLTSLLNNKFYSRTLIILVRFKKTFKSLTLWYHRIFSLGIFVNYIITIYTELNYNFPQHIPAIEYKIIFHCTN